MSLRTTFYLISLLLPGSFSCDSYSKGFEAGYITVSSAERVVFNASADVLRAPPVSAAWQPVTLPLIEYPAHYTDMADYQVSWFRIPVSALNHNSWQQRSIYIWRHNVRAGVYLADQFLGGTTGIQRVTDSPQNRIKISWNQPLLIDIPSQITGEDYLYIRVDAGPGGTILSPVLIGERQALLPLYETRHFFQVEVSFWLFILCIVLTGLGAWLWVQRRDEKLYLEFSLLSFFSSITTAFFFLDYVPISMHVWIATQHASTALLLMLVVRFTLDALSLDWPKLKRRLALSTIVVTSTYLVLPPYYLQPVGYSVSLLLTAANLLLGCYIIYLTIKSANGTLLWFSAAFIGLMVLQAHDIYYAFLSSPEAHIGASNWMQLSSPLLALIFFAHLIHRFTHALEISESLNRTLEARVAATNEALRLSYEKNREFELDTRANEERSKIYRALHDDLGSKLISIVHSAEDQKQRNLARGALESLRESIYKASHPVQSLKGCIEQIHEEAELRLTSAGKHYVSNIESYECFEIKSDAAYNLTRIFREAISNILQHSSCKQVEFQVKDSEGNLEIRLMDDGSGKIVESLKTGGLANIRYRAERMGALLAWQDMVNGNCLSLTLPVASLKATDEVTFH